MSGSSVHEGGRAPEPWHRACPDVPPDIALARVALGRVTEPEDNAVHRAVDELGVVETWERIRRGEGRFARFRLRVLDCEPSRDLAIADRLGARIVVPESPEWPSQLDDLVHPPHLLWVTGPVRLGEIGRSVAIVGSRSATPYGLTTAGELAAGVASRGVAVVSGAAYGIDAAAHRGALAVSGTTVAVLACGIDRVYPAGHDVLVRTIREVGCVATEISPGSAPLRGRFVSRNRVIAALTRATVVVEGSVRSGSLSTANRAGDISRAVGAVPGPVTSAESAGPHHLLRNRGATLVTEAADVVELVDPIGSAQDDSEPGPTPRRATRRTIQEVRWEQLRRASDEVDDEARRILDQMPRREPSTVDDLIRITTMPWEAVRAALSRLEVAGLVVQVADCWSVVRRPAAPHAHRGG